MKPLLLALLIALLTTAVSAATITGEVVDNDGKPIPCRLYIQNHKGEWFFPKSTDANGSAIEYRKERKESKSVEMHTTLSAHPFTVELPAGNYVFNAERGHEFTLATEQLVVRDEPLRVKLKLKRWVNMARDGWYSGDTHVHRPLAELPNLQLAEDLNVAFPLTHWVTKAYTPPAEGEYTAPVARAVFIDSTHCYYPRNTEYEIFSVGAKSHTLGAFFVLNHQKPFALGVPPVQPVAEQAREQGSLIELDKHNWPWSMALIPLLNVDLFELSNNHLWRTNFAFNDWGEKDAPWMNVEKDAAGKWTEAGWREFGLQNYYLLLNCGFYLRPTAGTATGVHPVPLGFGRVYVKVKGQFTYEKWLEGLNAGHSFVTTGPMIHLTANDQPPGSKIEAALDDQIELRVTTNSIHPISRLELIHNGEVIPIRILIYRPSHWPGDRGVVLEKQPKLKVEHSGWVAARCYELRPDGRERFAHTAPIYINVPGRNPPPKQREIDYLVQRVEDQIARSREVLTPEALAEYQKALEVYRELAKRVDE